MRLTLDSDGADVPDGPGRQVLKDAYAEGCARFLAPYHGVSLDGLNDLGFSRLAIGMALQDAARLLDLSPEMMFATIPLNAPGVGAYDRIALTQECAKWCRRGK